MSRRTRLAQCAVVMGVSIAAALVAALVEPAAAEGGSMPLAPSTFVVVLAAGTLLLGRVAVPHAAPAWATTMTLVAYLSLRVLGWQRTDPLGTDGASVFATGTLRPWHAGPDALVILTTTLGFLCVLSALADMWSLVRRSHARPHEEEDAVWGAEDAEADAVDTDGKPGPSLASLDEFLADVPLIEEPTAPDLEALATPAPAAAPAVTDDPPRRPSRLFE